MPVQLIESSGVSHETLLQVEAELRPIDVWWVRNIEKLLGKNAVAELKKDIERTRKKYGVVKLL